MYGTIANPLAEETNLKGLVVFNEDDVVRQSGYIKQVLIVFSKTLDPHETSNMLREVTLYVVASASDINHFQVLYAQKINESDYKHGQNISIFDLHNSTAYLEQGQYLAIGFDKRLCSPSYLTHQSVSYSLDFEVVHKAYLTNSTIKFQTMNKTFAISFQLIPTSGIITIHYLG